MAYMELVIPSHFLSALFNGDESGLEDGDIDALTSLTENALDHNACFFAVDAKDEGFLAYHDMAHLGVLACDCHTVTFDIGDLTPNRKVSR